MTYTLKLYLPSRVSGVVMASWVILFPVYILYEVLRESPTEEEDWARDIITAGWYRVFRRRANTEKS